MKQLLTKRQLLPILFAWGYTTGSLPRNNGVSAETGSDTVTLHIPAECRSGEQTRARLTVHNAKLYQVEFIN